MHTADEHTRSSAEDAADLAARHNSERVISEHIASLADDARMDYADELLTDWQRDLAGLSVENDSDLRWQEIMEQQAKATLIGSAQIADATDKLTCAVVSQTAMMAAKLDGIQRSVQDISIRIDGLAAGLAVGNDPQLREAVAADMTGRSAAVRTPCRED